VFGGIKIEVRLLHAENAIYPILVNELGSSIVLNPQPENPLIDFKPELSVTEVRFLQFGKPPRSVISGGMTIDFNE
jgi:hypothetical protein